jgi:hypothetical protein
MARRATLHGTFSKGELDPDLSERIDLEHYYDSLAAAPNCLFHPQGGVSDRGGFTLVSDADVLAAGTKRRLRRRIVPLHLTTANLTANNGGNTANLVDRDPATLFTTNAVTAAAFVVVEIDLGTSQYVDLVDLVDFSASDADADNVLAVQYWSGTAWTDFADPLDVAPRKHIRTAATAADRRTRRFGTAPGGPGGIRVAGRYWRVIAFDGVGVGQVSIGGLRLWQETATLSSIDCREVARETGTSYELVITERNIDVFEGMRYVASIPTPLAAQQIDEVTYGGGFDTLLIFHEMVETVRIVRQGSSGEWDVGATPFEDVPALTERIIFSGDQDEIQELTLADIEAGDVVHLALGGDVAAPLTYADTATLPSQIVTALDALPGVAGSGHLTVTVTAADPVTVRVRWTGNNGSRAWPLLSGLCAAPGVTITSRVVQAGLDSTGDLFSPSTGWPRCGTFVQQRLVVGGMRAAPTSLMFGRPGSWSFLDTGSPMTADLGFLRTLAVDGVETISSIFVGRHLQVFTEAGEWYAASQTLDATQPTPIIRVTSHGIRRAVPLAFADGATLFVQEGGRTLRDFLWRDAEQSYAAEPLSVLSPQILSDVVDVAHRSARSVTEGNLIFLVNRNGTAGCLTLLRGQNVIAGSPWSTPDGLFKAAMTDIGHNVFVITERGGEHYLERWTPNLPLDFATTVTGTDLTSVTGAWHVDGRDDVWAIADGEVLGPFTVQGGAFALGDGVTAASVTYGLLPAWSIRTQALRARLNQEMPFRPPARIYEAELAVKATGHLTLATNGGAHREVPLVRLGDAHEDGGPLQTADSGAPALPMFSRLYTGNIRMCGLIGWSRGPYVELGRSVPSPVTVKALRLEIVQKAD